MAIRWSAPASALGHKRSVIGVALQRLLPGPDVKSHGNGPEEIYCRGTMTGEEQESLALIILSSPNFLEGLMEPRLQTWK